MNKESLHWADQLAERIIERANKEKIIPNIKCQQTPSGGKHIGNLNDVTRAFFVYKSVLEKGGKCSFVHITDDRDPMKEVPQKIMDLQGNWHDSKKLVDFDKYMGMPYCRIPDPFKCCKSWSEHFTKVWMQGVHALKIKPELYSVDELYKTGKLEPYIIEIFKNIKEAGKIAQKYQQTKPENYIPFDAICPNCGKYSNIESFDLKKKTVSFTCSGKSIKKKIISGCSFKDEVPMNEGKLQWRFEWAAMMRVFNTTYEPMGKDHWEGSWKTLVDVMKIIFKKEPPIPFVYEFFLVDGKKMSASAGNVYTVQDMLKIIEPEVLLFFYAKRPEKQRDLELSRIFQLVDEFDFTERVYFGAEEARTENREENYKRMYEICMHEIPKKYPKRIDYKFLGVMAQLFDDKTIIKKLKKLNHLKDADKEDIKQIENRIKLARYWIKHYASDEMKFELQDSIKIKFSDKEIKALKLLATKLKKKKYTEEKLAEEIYNVANESGIEPKEFFKTAYRLLINKERGPRLASFILTIGPEKVIKLIDKI